MSPLATIGLIRSSSIGDVVLAAACIDMAEKVGVSIVWLGRPPAMDLLAAAYPEVRFVPMPKSVRSTIIDQTLSQCGTVDVWVDLQVNIRSQAYLKRIPQTSRAVSSPKVRWQRMKLVSEALLRRRLYPRPGQLKQVWQFHTMLDTFSNALELAGLPKQEIAAARKLATPNLSRLAKRRVDPSWSNDLSFGRWIALAPGAAHLTKQSPKELWLDVLEEFKKQTLRDPTIGLLIVGGDADRKISLDILDKLNWPGPLLNLTGKLNLADTATAVSKAQLLLTNDSGLLHIAEAVGTPVCAVFGPTVEEFGFAPWRTDSLVVSSNIGCRPCSRHGKLPCHYSDKLCFETVSVPKIVDKMKSTISERGAENAPESRGS